MRKTVWTCIVILCCFASSANAAGIQLFNQGPTLSGAIWYPCRAEPKYVELGDMAVAVDYGLVGVKDCPVTSAKLPLVVFSHGTGGWFGGHHDTAAALADAGFIVAAISHPGDTAKDSSRSDDLSIFGSRPADMVRLLDFLLQDWKDKAVVDQGRIGLFGFSMGGYTSLALIGVTPDFARACKDDATGFCAQLRSSEPPRPGPPQGMGRPATDRPRRALLAWRRRRARRYGRRAFRRQHPERRQARGPARPGGAPG